MTCREFRTTAENLTLWELADAQQPEILGHAFGCARCGEWLQAQRILAANVRALQARTSSCGASLKVEQAVLQAFRQRQAQSAKVNMPDRVAPLAWRLSRMFEIGAYAAVAAALAVVLFLGARLWQGRSAKHQARDHMAATIQSSSSTQTPELQAARSTATAHERVTRRYSQGRVRKPQEPLMAAGSHPQAAAPAQSNGYGGYTPLMFCDPLSCASDSQVVRMELPPALGQDSQPQIADLVVGYDGVVRAVRILN